MFPRNLLPSPSPFEAPFQEVGKTYSWHDAEERFMIENARRLFPEFAALEPK